MSVEACAELVERGDPERFRAVMAAPVAAREVLFPLHAFNIEVSRAPWVTQEPMIAEMRLQWWRDALGEIAEGGVVRRHEVVSPLARVLTRAQAGALDALVAARRADIARDPFADQAALEAYLADTSGLLMRVAAEALGAEDGEIAARRGGAMGVAQWLRAVPELEARGRVPLIDGRPEAVRDMARAALEAWRAGPKGSPAVRIALLAGWQTRALLERAVRDPGAVAEGRLAPGPMRSALSLARAAWRV
ncbi:squalene/phytoene synthase family protein [Pseudaestuariivita atlantica]|uniref:Phytoene synthase n=1 Tax=Pseudaestuariivita atlantica TaxID=1317121 RepID=A0A0L1JMD1_9RHOB|nr:squalene/phytoene synthase family protein [Pseudaestuariivita atlantica]KNG92910.1 phytoene synthase [Pseudaestuariivita atlantica]